MSMIEWAELLQAYRPLNAQLQWSCAPEWLLCLQSRVTMAPSFHERSPCRLESPQSKWPQEQPEGRSRQSTSVVFCIRRNVVRKLAIWVNCFEKRACMRPILQVGGSEPRQSC
jgi:hypothetical protein